MYVKGETAGLVLSVRPFKEKDQLVQLFTEKYGKRMILVKRAAMPNFRYKKALQCPGGGVFYLSLQEEGLGFIQGVKEEFSYPYLQTDPLAYTYAQYILELAQYALEDEEPDAIFYGYIRQGLAYLEEKKPPAVIAAIMALQILPKFGVDIRFDHCQLCEETRWDIPYDYSSFYHGVICERHFAMIENRWNLPPQVLFYLRKFQDFNFFQIGKIDIHPQWIRQIWQVIDSIYEEELGIRPASRRFLWKMEQSEAKIQALWERNVDKRKDLS